LPTAVTRLPKGRPENNTFLGDWKIKVFTLNIDLFFVLFQMTGGHWSDNPQIGI
jgi:hypothetical protein